MTNTILEMAEREFPIIDLVEFPIKELYEIREHRKIFRKGANAVLELFEEIICDDSFLHANRVHRAKELIKQLKR